MGFTSQGKRPNPLAAVGFLGDSITANGLVLPTNTNGLYFQLQSGAGTGSSFPAAAQLATPNMVLGSISATGGFTTAQILSSSLPALLAQQPQPKFVHVLAGANDSPWTVPAATFANLSAIYAAIAALGSTPILGTMTPRNDIVYPAINTLITINQWISLQAAANNWPLVDYYAACVAPATGQWASGLNTDNIHPNALGVETMAAAFSKVVAPLLVANRAYKPSANEWPDAANLTNVLFLNGAAGLPTNWHLAAGTAATLAQPAMGGTEGLGNWWSITRNAADAFYQTTSGYPSLAANHNYLLTFAVKTSNVVADSALWRIRFQDTSGNIIAGFNAMTADIPSYSTFRQVFQIPIGLIGNTGVFEVDVLTGNATIEIGEATVLDLTALGIG